MKRTFLFLTIPLLLATACSSPSAAEQYACNYTALSQKGQNFASVAINARPTMHSYTRKSEWLDLMRERNHFVGDLKTVLPTGTKLQIPTKCRDESRRVTPPTTAE